MDFEKLLTRLKDMGAGRLLFFSGSALGFLGLIVFIFMRFGQSDMSLLYRDMDPQESGKILDGLQSHNISFEMKRGEIYVPSSQLLRARMSLAEMGVSAGSTMGYEIFDKSDALGTTSFVQNVNLVRALEGELSRTIQTIQSVAQARVHIVMPERKIFSKEKRKPSAAVVLRMRSLSTLSEGQVQAIRYLVSSAVPELQVEGVSILDDRGVLLASDSEKNARDVSREAEERRVVYETRLGRMIESLLEQSLGAGSVRAEVSADLDYDSITEQSETFNPDGQVVRSQQSVNDSNQSNNAQEPATGVQQEMPNVQQAPGASGKGSTSESNKTEETTNYEISKTVRTAVRGLGGVKRLSVAVVIDGTYTKNEQGEEAYADRTPEEMEKYKRLIQAVVGYQQDRGDVVDVENLRFHRPEEENMGSSSWLPSLSEENLMRLAEIALLGFFALVLFFFGIRPYLKPATDEGAEGLQVAMAGAEGASLEGGEGAEGPGGEDDKQLKGWEKMPEDELRALVNKLALEKPERAASIVRLWMKG